MGEEYDENGFEEDGTEGLYCLAGRCEGKRILSSFKTGRGCVKDREHNISLDKAISFIHNADLSITKWNGQFENYYSKNGAAFVNLAKNEIRTAFCYDEYDEKAKALMEVIEKWKKK